MKPGDRPNVIRKKPQKNPTKNFVKNPELLEEIRKSKARLALNPEYPAAAMTPRLVEMIVLMVNRYATVPGWANYSYNDEMKSEARENLCSKWHKFDETRFDNPFAYYTKIMYTSFLGVLAKEKRVQDIRDDLRQIHELEPSYTRQVEHAIEQKRVEGTTIDNPPVEASEEKAAIK